MSPENHSSGTPADVVSSSNRRSALPFCLVGIGASAGGLEAAKELVRALMPDAGMAYMLILHLPASHESMLADILSRVSSVPVAGVQDGMPIERDRIYVLPGGYDLEIEDDCLKLKARQAPTGQHRPIDHYFRLLAAHQGEKSIGVVLSGTGSDGALGIQEIKAVGGITFAQDDTAEQTSMPRSAIGTGAVDFVLAPGDIAAELGRISGHPYIAVAPEGTFEPPDITPVLDIIRIHTGVDFLQYKRNSSTAASRGASCCTSSTASPTTCTICTRIRVRSRRCTRTS